MNTEKLNNTSTAKKVEYWKAVAELSALELQKLEKEKQREHAIKYANLYTHLSDDTINDEEFADRKKLKKLQDGLKYADGKAHAQDAKEIALINTRLDHYALIRLGREYQSECPFTQITFNVCKEQSEKRIRAVKLRLGNLMITAANDDNFYGFTA